MQTNIAKSFHGQPGVAAAESILRKCVHCGFCLATCPTYNILGDELDSPRGRIYQIKQVLEGSDPTASTQLHLDRCLTCRNCETTCPSGVEYGQLLDIGRAIVEKKVERPLATRLMRWGVRAILPYPSRIGPLVWVGQKLKPLMPGSVAASVPVARAAGEWPESRHSRKMLVLEGCVQPSMSPAVNVAAARVLDRLGVSLLRVGGGCCGAIRHHLNDHDGGVDDMRHNIDAWWPHVEQGCEAIVMTASGCGAMVKDYARLLCDDPAYATKAARISAMTLDICEVMTDLVTGDSPLTSQNSALTISTQQAMSLVDPAATPAEATETARPPRVVFHPPCTLQHGQKLAGKTEALLTKLGFELLPVDDAQECCGSAGTYSLFQPQLSRTLKAKKIANLRRSEPDIIATANIGCMLHLQSATTTPVVHWIEMLDKSLPAV